MPKDLSQMFVSAIVPTKYIRDVLIFLEDHDGDEIVSRPVRSTAASTKANSPAMKQTDWLALAIRKPTKSVDLHDQFKAAGYRYDSFYSALTQAVALKKIKRVKPGIYTKV